MYEPDGMWCGPVGIIHCWFDGYGIVWPIMCLLNWSIKQKLPMGFTSIDCKRTVWKDAFHIMARSHGTLFEQRTTFKPLMSFHAIIIGVFVGSTVNVKFYRRTNTDPGHNLLCWWFVDGTEGTEHVCFWCSCTAFAVFAHCFTTCCKTWLSVSKLYTQAEKHNSRQ